MDMSDEKGIPGLSDRIKKLEKNTQLNYEALLTIRAILDVQSQRLDNLEDFMQKMTGGKPNPNVGVPPVD
jgi:hypothetical protein